MNDWKKKLLDEGTIHLELFVTRKCNIKCKNGMVYCNINKSEEDVLYPLEQLEKDLKHLVSVGVKIDSVSIMGGEPAMQDNLVDYLYIVRRIANPKCLSIFTNVVGLKNLCNEAGVKALKETHTGVCYTRYSKYILNAAANLTYMRNNDIVVNCIGDLEFSTQQDDVIQNDFNKQTLLPSDTDDSKKLEHFSGCEHDLLFLCNGKLYTCGRSFNIKYLNKKFNLNYPEDSCIEVSSVTSPEELFTFCRTPGKLCSFCANVDSNNSQKVAWSQDPAELSDYLP